MHSLTETQKITDNKVLTIVLVGVVLFPLGILISELIAMDRVQQDELVAISAGVLAMCLGVFLVLKTYSRLQLTEKGLQHTYYMLFSKKINIPKEKVARWEITEHRFFQGMGVHRNFKGQWTYVLTPGKALSILTTDGKKLKFGINNSRKVRQFIHTHWEQNQRNYG